MALQEVRLPEGTQAKLNAFRRQVRRVKILEGILAGLFGLAVSWVIVFSSDRLIDTPTVVRAALLLMGCLGFGLFFPLKCHRWIWGTRTMNQVARLVSHRYPALGDQLLGIVELTSGERDLGSSRELAIAAIEQVDTAVSKRNLSDAIPQPRGRRWATAAAIPSLLMVLAVAFVPAAAWNATARWMMPWSDFERFTFAQIDALPDAIVVPHGENFNFRTRLTSNTQWSPESGRVSIDSQPVVESARANDEYSFQLSALTTPGTMKVRIGDVRESVNVLPAPRPELTSMSARITLPDYLQYSHTLQQDARSGTVSAVKGSTLAFDGEITRELSDVTISSGTVTADGARIQTSEQLIEDSTTLELQWTDELGLSSRQPFPISIRATDDLEPQIACIQDDIQQVVLSTDVITFSLSATDDFGVESMGLEWSGVAPAVHNPASEPSHKLVQAGGPEKQSLNTQATFCAASDGVAPQSLKMRAWAKDYKPERGRVYSPEFVLHVLSPEDHAVWLADQLRRWTSRADDVYEQEMRLHDANRELRRMDPDSLASTESQQRIQRQSAAERTNAQRLSQVTTQGDNLIRQALKNEEMLVGHLETFAQSLQQLKDIAENRMPTVSDLLTQAAQSASQQAKSPGKPSEPGNNKSAPMAGNDRSKPSTASNPSPKKKSSPPLPSIVDKESGFNPNPRKEERKQDDQKPSPAGKGKFGLPQTTLQGGPSPKKKQQSEESESKVAEAVEQQADLLAAFEKVREEMQKIMDDLDNSTFVKRLKAASRRQLELASSLNRTLFTGFGRNAKNLDERFHDQTERIASGVEEESRSIWVIKSDLEAYYSRRKEEKFRRIADQMTELNVVTRLELLGTRVRDNKSGDSISRVEFWADTLDRWAEELVAPSKCGSCKKGKGGESLPPAVVLEIMRLLEGEIDLRDETRAAETARSATEITYYDDTVAGLCDTQQNLRKRALNVINDIIALPEGSRHFGKELDLLDSAAAAMQDAAHLLAEPSTDANVIAAETEVIELLLQSKRANPKSGGGGSGSSPGGGSDGETETVALALHGPGADPHAHIESREVRQAIGQTDNSIPAEYRDGVEAFFNAVEAKN